MNTREKKKHTVTGGPRRKRVSRLLRVGVVREIQSPDILHLMTSQRLVVLLFKLLTGIIQVKIQVYSKKPSNSPYHGITIMICSTSCAVVSCPSGAALSSCRWSTRRQRNTHIVRKAVSHSSRALRSLSQKKYIVRNSGKSRPCKGHLLYSGTRKKGVEGWCKEKWAEQ